MGRSSIRHVLVAFAFLFTYGCYLAYSNQFGTFLRTPETTTKASLSCITEAIINGTTAVVANNTASPTANPTDSPTNSPIQQGTSPPQEDDHDEYEYYLTNFLRPPLPPQSSSSSAVADTLDVSNQQQQQHTMLCIFADSGLGSQLVQMLAQKLYYSEHDVQFIVDDNHYGYKWDDQKGVLRGYFTPHFPTLKPGDYLTYFQEPYGLPDAAGVMGLRAFRMANSNDNTIHVQWAINEGFRNNFQQQHGNTGFKLYHRFVSEACHNLQFNARAMRAMQQYIQQHANGDSNVVIPDLRRHSHSVAFHVRRGDKVQLGESRAYQGREYVETLLQVLHVNHKNATDIQDCFVASDDYRAIDEMRDALRERNVGCQVHYLASRTELAAGIHKASYLEREFTIQFLAELRGKSLDTIAEATTRNAENLFNLENSKH